MLDPSRKNLDIRESINQGVYVANLSEFETNDLETTLNILCSGDAYRIVAETKLNE